MDIFVFTVFEGVKTEVTKVLIWTITYQFGVIMVICDIYIITFYKPIDHTEYAKHLTDEKSNKKYTKSGSGQVKKQLKIWPIT